jgi:hypothetical protein
MVRGDDDLVSEVGERAGGVRADHPEPSGDQDHRTTSVCVTVTSDLGRWLPARSRAVG